MCKLLPRPPLPVGGPLRPAAPVGAEWETPGPGLPLLVRWPAAAEGSVAVEGRRHAEVEAATQRSAQGTRPQAAHFLELQSATTNNPMNGQTC